MDDALAMKLLDWERDLDPKAPLTAKQRDVIMELSMTASERPLPAVFKGNKQHPYKVQATDTDRGTVDRVIEPYSSLINGEKKIETAYQFFEWFAKIEENMILDDEEKYKGTLSLLSHYGTQCGLLLEEVESSLYHLKSLDEQYRLVSTKTNSLHEACEQLLAEQTRLVNAAEHISEKLSYFNEVDKILQKLNSPTLSVVNESFIPMLSRLDECIAFLTTNPNYKESGTYLVNFRHCLSKALSLIHTYVVRSLQNSTQQAAPSNKEATITLQNGFALFYGKFRTNASRIKALMEQIEVRVYHGPEYEQLLSDCHQCYCNQREILIVPSFTVAVADLTSSHQRDHCTLIRSGCNLLLRLCEDEHQLFFQFFSKPSDHLHYFLDKLCQRLYDVLRPLVIHINHLETLAELCSILKVEMLEEHVNSNAIRLNAFESFVTQMLQDVQERLVYRSHVYVQTDILNYRPAPGDLAYPEKLQMMESIAESLMQGRLTRTESQSSLASTSSVTSQEVASITSSSQQHKLHSRITAHSSPADMHGMWYPTVRRTLGCLSKLYHCIDRAIFQGLSQEALSTCIQSLIIAGDTITKKETPLDGQLFQIKHLLILREQITPFHADFSVKETALDFSKVRSAAANLISKRSRLLSFSSSNALLEFIVAGTPQVTEHSLDSKKDVDTRLKSVCDDLIGYCTTLLTSPLKIFLDKVDVALKVDHETNGACALPNQSFASAEQVASVVTETNRQLKSRLPGLQRSLSLYLANRETEAILFRPIKVSVTAVYQKVFEIVRGNYVEDDQVIIACPSTDQVLIVLTSLNNAAGMQVPSIATMDAESVVEAEAEAESQAHSRRNLPDINKCVDSSAEAIANAGDLLYDRLEKTTSVEESLVNSVTLLEDCLRNRYEASDICISFNGGKDCTVLLHLYHAVLQRQKERRRIIAFYVECADPFPEVEQFVTETVTRYNLDLFKVPGPIKNGLEKLLRAKPNIKGILMGNRRTDPYSKHLQTFQETDSGWPEVIRVFPLLDWSYSNIWQFLRQLHVPYCALYDRGYTSLGSRHNTAPNPNLKYFRDGEVEASYHPAYTLDDHDEERNGRQ